MSTENTREIKVNSGTHSASTTKLSLLPDGGNVGIGTTSPLRKLHIDFTSVENDHTTRMGSTQTNDGILIHNQSNTIGSYSALDFRNWNADFRIANVYKTNNTSHFVLRLMIMVFFTKW